MGFWTEMSEGKRRILRALAVTLVFGPLLWFTSMRASTAREAYFQSYYVTQAYGPTRESAEAFALWPILDLWIGGAFAASLLLAAYGSWRAMPRGVRVFLWAVMLLLVGSTGLQAVWYRMQPLQ